MHTEWHIAKIEQRTTATSRKSPLKIVAIDILGPLCSTLNSNQNGIVENDRCSKLIQAMSTGKKSSSHLADVYFDYWVVPYGIPVYILMEKEVQFTSKLLGAICTILGEKHLTTTAYHPQTNGQVKRYNCMIITQLPQYVAQR